MTILIADTFTAANGTAINNRTPEKTVFRRTWKTGALLGTTGPSGTVDIQSNKARMTTSDDGFATDIGYDDYNITWYCTLPASGQFRGGCIFRAQNSVPFSAVAAVDYYFFTVRFDLASGNIRLIKVVDGVETTLGSDVTMSFSYSTTYKMDLTVVSNTYTLYVDGVSKKSETDSTYPSGQWAGIKAGAVSGNDFTVDSFQASAGVTAPMFGGGVVR